MSSDEFPSYYYLKEELVEFCRSEGLQITGKKSELNDRICRYLDSGEKVRAPSRKRQHLTDITLDTPIGEDYVCSEVSRTFFKEHLGGSFTFKVTFLQWLRDNPDKTHRDAIVEYGRIMSEKKKTMIGKQFEYNTYIRDFFEDNQGLTLSDAIVCWKYKKSLKGSNKYERTDLDALN